MKKSRPKKTKKKNIFLWFYRHKKSIPIIRKMIYGPENRRSKNFIFGKSESENLSRPYKLTPCKTKKNCRVKKKIKSVKNHPKDPHEHYEQHLTTWSTEISNLLNRTGRPPSPPFWTSHIYIYIYIYISVLNKNFYIHMVRHFRLQILFFTFFFSKVFFATTTFLHLKKICINYAPPPHPLLRLLLSA